MRMLAPRATLRGSLTLGLVAILVSATGCGQDPSRPSESELARVFASKDSPLGMPLPAKQAKCLARVYDDSGLSASYLKALAAGRAPKPGKGDQDRLDDLQAAIARDCVAL